MTLRIITAVALTACLAASTFTTASAQCTTPNPGYGPAPLPQPAPLYFGVRAKTVPVDTSAAVETFTTSKYTTRVAPGYGEAVYGQMIVGIAPDSAAYHAGLEVGDVIIDANGIPMDSGQNLVQAVQSSGGYLEMKVLDVNSNQIVWVVADFGGGGGQVGGPDTGIIETARSGRTQQNQRTAKVSNRLRTQVQMFQTPGRRPPTRRR